MASLFKGKALSYISPSHSLHKQLLGSDSRLDALLGSQNTKKNRVGVLAIRELTQLLVRRACKQTMQYNVVSQNTEMMNCVNLG